MRVPLALRLAAGAVLGLLALELGFRRWSGRLVWTASGWPASGGSSAAGATRPSTSRIPTWATCALPRTTPEGNRFKAETIADALLAAKLL